MKSVLSVRVILDYFVEDELCFRWGSLVITLSRSRKPQDDVLIIPSIYIDFLINNNQTGLKRKTMKFRLKIIDKILYNG